MRQFIFCFSLVLAGCGRQAQFVTFPQPPEADPSIKYVVSFAAITVTDAQLQQSFGVPSAEALLASPEKRSIVGAKILYSAVDAGVLTNFHTNFIVRTKMVMKMDSGPVPTASTNDSSTLPLIFDRYDGETVLDSVTTNGWGIFNSRFGFLWHELNNPHAGSQSGRGGETRCLFELNGAEMLDARFYQGTSIWLVIGFVRDESAVETSEANKLHNP